jgi:asparagine synthetase B (glutamine-hydrolysing)
MDWSFRLVIVLFRTTSTPPQPSNLAKWYLGVDLGINSNVVDYDIVVQLPILTRMCGIHASRCITAFLGPSPELKQLLCNRGPDHVGEAQVKIGSYEEPLYFSFTSTVLALRGGHVTPQPFTDPGSGSILCWNGEAWRIDSEEITGNDGQLVFGRLLNAISTQNDVLDSTRAILDVFRSISGPFAFVFLDWAHAQIFFARDRLGRRSLLFNLTPGSMEFSSTADPSRGTWEEVEADAIYVLSRDPRSLSNGLQNLSESSHSSCVLPLQKYRWESDTDLLVCVDFSLFAMILTKLSCRSLL